MIYKLAYLVLTITLLISCDRQGLTEIPTDKFIGTWELRGRGIYDGIQLQIQKENDKLIGRLTKLNENKYVQMFSELEDVWVSNISRSSNYQFRLTERKIGRELFALYGISTSQEFKVEFINDDTIGLSTGGNPNKSSIKYVRIK